MRLQLMSMLGVHHNAELKVLQLCFSAAPDFRRRRRLYARQTCAYFRYRPTVQSIDFVIKVFIIDGKLTEKYLNF